MLIKQAEAALAQVAENYGKEPAEIKREIEIAIAEAMSYDDPGTQRLWKALCVDGRAPTAEEFLVVIAFLCS